MPAHPLAERGRPRDLTPEVLERVTDQLELGNSWREAAASVGQHMDALTTWARRGRRELERREQDEPRTLSDLLAWLGKATFEDDFVRFFTATEKARLNFRQRALGVIVSATLPHEGDVVTTTVTRTLADGTVETTTTEKRTRSGGLWTPAAWLLERKFPEEFGRWSRSQVEVTGKDGAPIAVEVEDRLAQSLEAFLAGAAARQAIEAESEIVDAEVVDG